MADAEKSVLKAIRLVLKRRDAEVPVAEVSRDAGLYDDLMMDSLEVAELSAELEDDLGRDPYTEGLLPRTVGEVIEFYETQQQ